MGNSHTSQLSESSVDPDCLITTVQLAKIEKSDSGEEMLLVDMDAVKEVLWNQKYEDCYVVIYTIAGPARSGKSFLLSMIWHFLNSCNGKTIAYEEWLSTVRELKKVFRWKRGVTSCTQGICILKEPFIIQVGETKLALFLADTQGIFDHNCSERNQTFLGTFSFLLSSFLIFNVQNGIETTHIESIYAFANDLRGGDGCSMLEKGLLMFVVRDWFSNESDEDEEDFAYGMDGGKKYFNKLIGHGSTNEARLRKMRREYLEHAFGNNIPCCLLPHPGNAVFAQETCNVINLTDKFKRESFKFFQNIGSEIKIQSKIKLMQKKCCTCRELCNAIDDYTTQLGLSLNISDRSSFLEKDMNVKMSRNLRACINDFMQYLYSKQDSVLKGSVEIIIDNCETLKEETKSKFRRENKIYFPQGVVDEWEDELGRVLSQSIQILITCLHFQKAYKDTICDYINWLEKDAITEAENFASKACAKREALLESMENYFRENSQAEVDFDSALDQCKEYFTQHTNKITAGIDTDIQEFLKNMKIAKFGIGAISVGLGAAVVIYTYPALASATAATALETIAAAPLTLLKNAPDRINQVKKSCITFASGVGAGYKAAKSVTEKILAKSYSNKIKSRLPGHDSQSSLGLQHYKDGKMAVQLWFGVLTFNLKVRGDLEG